MNNRCPVCAAAVLLAVTSLATAADVERTDLFVAGEGGYAVYRIPGIVASGRGTLLAYCEARKTSGDWSRIDLLLRRSTDGGRTWEKPRVVARPPPGARKNPAAVAHRQGNPDEITVNNPVAIADAQSGGVVHFLYCVEYERCFYLRSDDDGVTFSPPVEITATFEKFRPEYDWKVLATGPGHGVRLRGGRLLVPVWLSDASSSAHHPSCVATIYSDDGGKTWERGDIVVGPDVLADPSEGAAADLSDGRVMLNIRHEGRRKGAATHRAVTVSPDGSTKWEPVRLDEALPDPVCMASLVRSPAGLLFCNPENDTNRERKNLTLKRSRDDGKSWTVERRIEPGPSGYSDLAVGADGIVYCLYERGKAPAALSLVRLKLRP